MMKICAILILAVFPSLIVLPSCGNDDSKAAAEDGGLGNDSSDARGTDTGDDTSRDTGPTNGNPIPDEIVLETVSREAKYIILEGPVWDGVDTLYFSDVDNNTVYRFKDDAVTTFRTNSNGTNGLMFDLEGRLCGCEGTGQRLVAMDVSGNVAEVLSDSFNGKPFNRPNDLVFDAHGGVYFTDPTWNAVFPQDANGVYYRDASGSVSRLIDDMNKPNGIILSPDQQTLYVDDWASLTVRAYDIVAAGEIAGQRNLAQLRAQSGGQGAEADGMTVDTAGNLYVATADGIQVFSASGDYIDIVPVPGGPTNCTFGGEEMKSLFITTRPALYRVEMRIPGIQFPVANL